MQAIAVDCFFLLGFDCVCFRKAFMTSTPTPKTLKRPKRNRSVSVHLSPNEKASLDRAAFTEDMGTSQFVRRLILRFLEAAENANAQN